MVDRALADELRAACTTVALNLGGWDKKSKSKSGNPGDPKCAPWLCPQLRPTRCEKAATGQKIGVRNRSSVLENQTVGWSHASSEQSGRSDF